MCPPQPGTPSYDEFYAQKTGILESLARRAGKVAKGLRRLGGVTCALYSLLFAAVLALPVARPFRCNRNVTPTCGGGSQLLCVEWCSAAVGLAPVLIRCLRAT